MSLKVESPINVVSFTGNKALISNASKDIVESNITTSDLFYLSGLNQNLDTLADVQFGSVRTSDRVSIGSSGNTNWLYIGTHGATGSSEATKFRVTLIGGDWNDNGVIEYSFDSYGSTSVSATYSIQRIGATWKSAANEIYSKIEWKVFRNDTTNDFEIYVRGLAVDFFTLTANVLKANSTGLRSTYTASTATVPTTGYTELTVTVSDQPYRMLNDLLYFRNTTLARSTAFSISDLAQVANILYDGTSILASHKIQTIAGTTESASLRILAGVAPTTSVAGDIWNDGSYLFYRNNSGTRYLTTTAGMTTNNIPKALGAGIFGDSLLYDTGTEVNMASGLFRIRNANATDAALVFTKTGDTASQFAAYMDGTLEWGAGGSTARDTNLYRAGINSLKTDDNFEALTIKKTGGTSSQFLKADGSVDATSYLSGDGIANQVPYYDGTSTITGDAGFTNQTSGGITKQLAIGNYATANDVFYVAKQTSGQLAGYLMADSAQNRRWTMAIAGTDYRVGRWTNSSTKVDDPFIIAAGSAGLITIGGTSNSPVSLTGALSVTGATTLATSLSGILKATAGVVSTVSASDITGTLLTGYAVGSNTALAATDSILGAFQKLQGQVNARLTANQTITLSGIVTGSGTTAITTAIADGALSIAKTSGLQTALDGAVKKIAPRITTDVNDFVSENLITDILSTALNNPGSSTSYILNFRNNSASTTYCAQLAITRSATSPKLAIRNLDNTNWTSWDYALLASQNPDLVAIEALAGTSGLLRKTAENTWTLDTTSYEPSLGYTPVNKAGDSMTGNLEISKTSPKLILTDTNTTTGSYPSIQFDTTANQGISIEYNEFDGELPIGGYGLIVKQSPNNNQFPTTGTISLSVLGEIYSGSTTVGGLSRVLNQSNFASIYPDLTAVESLATTGFVRRTGTNTWSASAIAWADVSSLAGSTSTSFALGNHNHTLDGLSNTTITSNTNGEILKWNGTAWINNTLAEAGIQATLTNPVTGTGTTNTLSKFTGTSTLGNSTLTDNGATLQTTNSIRSIGYPTQTGLTGQGVELHYVSTYGRLLAYDRTNSVRTELRIDGNPIAFYVGAGTRYGTWDETDGLIIGSRDAAWQQVIYRNNTAVGASTGLKFRLLDSAGSAVDYSGIQGRIVSNTPGAETGGFKIRALDAGVERDIAQFSPEGVTIGPGAITPRTSELLYISYSNTAKIGVASEYTGATVGVALAQFNSTAYAGSDQKLINGRAASTDRFSVYADGTIFSNSLTASRVVVTDGSKNLVSSGITTTKLDYLTDVTSNIQAQINGKVSTNAWNSQTIGIVAVANNFFNGSAVGDLYVRFGDSTKAVLLGVFDGVSGTNNASLWYTKTGAGAGGTFGVTGAFTANGSSQLNGTVTLAPQTLTNFTNATRPSHYIGQAMADNDYWAIYGEGSVSNSGSMVFETGDDGSEPFIWRMRNVGGSTSFDRMTLSSTMLTANVGLTVSGLSGTGTELAYLSATGQLLRATGYSLTSIPQIYTGGGANSGRLAYWETTSTLGFSRVQWLSNSFYVGSTGAGSVTDFWSRFSGSVFITDGGTSPCQLQMTASTNQILMTAGNGITIGSSANSSSVIDLQCYGGTSFKIKNGIVETNSSIVPSGTTVDLGASATKFRNLYLDGIQIGKNMKLTPNSTSVIELVGGNNELPIPVVGDMLIMYVASAGPTSYTIQAPSGYSIRYRNADDNFVSTSATLAAQNTALIAIAVSTYQSNPQWYLIW